MTLEELLEIHEPGGFGQTHPGGSESDSDHCRKCLVELGIQEWPCPTVRDFEPADWWSCAT